MANTSPREKSPVEKRSSKSTSSRRSAGKTPVAPEPDAGAAWTFLTNHGHVLLSIAADPTARLRDLAERVGITERAVQRIVAELEEAGYLTHDREGRRNVYRIRAQLPLRHPVERHKKVAVLLSLVEGRS